MFGEGPLAEASNPVKAQGFNEGQKYTAADVRYVQKGKYVYATPLGWPEGNSLELKALRSGVLYCGKVKKVELLGYGKVDYVRDGEGLKVTLPDTKPNEIAPVLKIKVK